MTDTRPYPRRTIDSIVAALAGSVGAVVISFAMIQAAINGQALKPASVYATSTLGAPTVNASTTNSGSLTLNGLKTLAYFSSATSSIDAAVVPNGTCAALGTVAVTGAQASSTSPGTVSIGYDPVFKSGYATHTQITGYVSSYGTVTVEGCAGTSTAMIDPPALVFRATVTNFNP